MCGLEGGEEPDRFLAEVGGCGAFGVQEAVVKAPAQRFGFVQEATRGLAVVGFPEAGEDVVGCLRRGMRQVFGAETVITQVVDEQLVGGEVFHVLKRVREHVYGQMQYTLAQSVGVLSLLEVPHRRDGEDDA